MAKKPTIEHVNAALKRWRSRLTRAVRMVDKLEKQRGRIEKATLRLFTEIEIVDQPKPAPVIAAPPIDTGIPSFLRRDKTPDPVAEEIKAEQEEIKKKKARGRIEKMKAKKAGDLKKMPLTGRAALEAIRNG
jgi:hypothetical protein